MWKDQGRFENKNLMMIDGEYIRFIRFIRNVNTALIDSSRLVLCHVSISTPRVVNKKKSNYS